jgi:hypothetical protein
MGKTGARAFVGGGGVGGRCCLVTDAAGIFLCFVLLSSLLTLIVGVVHVSSRLKTFCDSNSPEHAASSDAPCFGPWLFWQRSGSQVEDVNAHWRKIFSFSTAVFFDLWTPIFFGVAGLNMTVPSLLSGGGAWDSGQWRFCSIFYILSALFGSFGYGGNLGVIAGFVNVIAAFGALISSFVS